MLSTESQLDANSCAPTRALQVAFHSLAQLGRRIQQQAKPHAPNRRPQRRGVLAVSRGHQSASEEGRAVDGGLEESRGNVGVGFEENETVAEQLLRRRAAEIGSVLVGGEESPRMSTQSRGGGGKGESGEWREKETGGVVAVAVD